MTGLPSEVPAPPSLAQEGLLSTVPAELRALGPTWLDALRREAHDALRDGGLPGKKHEAWRFTSVRELADQALPLAGGDREVAMALAERTYGEAGTFRVVLADGRPVELAAPPAGVRVESLATLLKDEPTLVEGTLGRLAGKAHFAGLNAALFRDGVALVIARDAIVETPLHLVHVATGAGVSHPRVIVIAGSGSQCTVVESFLDAGGEGAHLTNVVTEIDLGPGAHLDHVRVTEGSPRATQVGALAVRQARDSRYTSRVVALGGKLLRLDLEARLEGPGAEAVLEGVYHLAGEDHVDHHVRVVHAAPRCTSHLRYRGLVDGRGHAVFDAIGVVEKGTPGSSVHQENKNLLLGDEARVDTKPHLEIETDDVSASHGTTVGALDPAQTFYLRSRGIPELLARDLLTIGFVQELLSAIPHAPSARRATQCILSRLPHGADLAEVLG